jgi:hypothetical protein
VERKNPILKGRKKRKEREGQDRHKTKKKMVV